MSMPADHLNAEADAAAARTAPVRHHARPRRDWLRAGWVMTASGWSANQFSALLGAYRGELGLSTAATTGLFAVYVVGLIPGLLLGSPAADRLGRRRVALGALALSAVATCTLMAGSTAVWLLWPGRFLTGLGAGVLLTAGSVWIKELSSPPHDTAAAPGVAARRSGLFLSAGFATGGLAASFLAQWAPYPMVTAYVPHLVLSAVAAATAFGSPETTGAAPAAQVPAPDMGPVRARFRALVVPVAPWVFAAPTLAFATLPGLVDGGLDGWQTVYAGVATAVTPGSGLLVQPLARRLAARHRLATAVAGMSAVAVGLLVAAFAAAHTDPAVALAAAALIGAGYGLCVTYGLTEVALLAPPGGLARLTSRFWVLAYLGFFAPYGFTLLSGPFDPAAILLAAAGLAVVTGIGVTLAGSRAAE
ncbi:MFS transporter [Streptomyces sp. NPDC050610]|uniref:MFS transporter n=1 Tax=Streptomyces sp. NPDC050610 TaxID=3157097 RepID=UPI0034240E10